MGAGRKACAPGVSWSALECYLTLTAGQGAEQMTWVRTLTSPLVTAVTFIHAPGLMASHLP